MIFKCTECSFFTLYKQSLKHHVSSQHGLVYESEIKPEGKYRCLFCDYNSEREYNVKRHMVLKHKDTSIISNNPHLGTNNPHRGTNNPHFGTNNPHLDTNNPHDDIKENETTVICKDCQKEFFNEKSLKRHLKFGCRKCVDSQCKFCNKILSNTKNRWRHEQSCSKKETYIKRFEDEFNGRFEDSDNGTSDSYRKDYNLQLAKGRTDSIGTGSINCNGNQNSITINQQNNIDQSINVNLIAFPLDGVADGRLFYIPEEKLNGFYQKITKAIRQGELKAIETIVHELLDQPANKIIRKPDLKTGYSYVHLGDGQWKALQDVKVYPKIIHQATVDGVETLKVGPPSIKDSDFVENLDEFGGNVFQFIDGDTPIKLTEEEIECKKKIVHLTKEIKLKAHENYQESRSIQ